MTSKASWRSGSGGRRLSLWLLGALILAGALFAQAIDYPLMKTWDDAAFVLERAEVRNWWSASWTERLLTPDIGYPLPLPTLVYAHAHQWFGDHSIRALRLLVLGLHLGNALLIGRLVKGWYGRRLGVAVAALWVVHPVVVESVVWMTNLKTVLAAAFILVAMNCWEGVREVNDGASVLAPYAAITLCFVAAAGCRPDAAIIPALLAVQSVLCEAPHRSLRRHAAFLGSLSVLAGAYLTFSDTGHDRVVERSIFFEGGLEAALARVFHALEISTRNIVWPADLHPAYFQHWREGIVEALPGMAIALAVVAVVIAALHSGKRQSAFPLLLAAVLYAPFSNIVFLPRFTADTYLYLVSFAALTAALVLLRSLLDARLPGWFAQLRWRGAAVSALVGLFAVYAALTFGQVRRWADPVALWEPVMEAQPNAPRPYRHIGWEYARQGDLERARQVLDRGYVAFRASRDIPALYVEVVALSGDPKRAVSLSVEAINQNRTVEPLHYRLYLEALVQHEIRLPDDEPVERATDKAVEAYRQHPQWLEQEGVASAVGAYFIDQGRTGWATPFVEVALEGQGQACHVWRMVQALPDKQREALDTPPRPADCGPN